MKKKVHVSLILAGLLMTIVAFKASHVLVEQVQVRVFTHLKISELQIYSPAAGYKLFGDGKPVSPVLAGINYKLVQRGDSICVIENQKTLGTFRYIRLVTNVGGELRVKPILPDKKVRSYPDNLSLSVTDNSIRIINEVQLDHYIAGVTDAEAGTKCSPEFYKVQAILARTFALAHINKHVTEGFSLCDLVHCQAYHGRPRDENVVRAVNDTQGMVVVDQNLDLIVAAFHSNSGGQTANSEDVWGGRTSYLRSVVDTFSYGMPNARWEKRMATQEWLNYLKEKHNYPVHNDSGRKTALNFRQESRKAYLEFNNSRVSLRSVREDLKLRSTFFDVTVLNKDSIVLKGRGYGHGLGMCQEGAMHMARKGYTYQYILNYYYQNIQLIDLEKLKFFRDE